MFSLPIFALLTLTLSMCYTIQIMNFASPAILNDEYRSEMHISGYLLIGKKQKAEDQKSNNEKQ